MARSPSWILCVAVLAALALAAPSSAGKARRVALGDYEATLATPPADGWVQGRFTVVKSKPRRAIVPTEEFGGIFYPDANECERFAAPLVAGTVPIDRRGKFRIRERTKADAGNLVVTWSGRWREPRVVGGSVVIRYGDCVSRHRWTGARTP